MKHVMHYSPTTRLFYIGSQSALPADAYAVTSEQVEEITAQNAVAPDYTEIDAKRRMAYTEEVDPLISEAAIKRGQGCEAEAKSLMLAAIAARDAIQARYPKPSASGD